MTGQILAFEGVDGAGKSTVLGKVRQVLESRGERVFLPRTGKEHASRPTRMIRRLTRDRRNLALSARAELGLYCAREAQVLDELVRPALARGETVLLDRSLLTPLVLGCFGRGLPRAECEAAVMAASGGLVVDHTLIFNVHPRTSRIRKRTEKIRKHTLGSGGRKGLLGSGLKERVQQGYLTLAEERGWPVFHVERVNPEVLAERVVKVLDGAPLSELQTSEDEVPEWQVPPELSLEEALTQLSPGAALFLTNGLVSARALRRQLRAQEPELVAWSMDPEDPLRSEIAKTEPEYALRTWARRPLEPGDLRLELLKHAPAAAIRALKHLETPQAERLRRQYAAKVPGAVLASLSGREDPAADELRRLCWKNADVDERAASLTFCDHDAAWEWRKDVGKEDPARVIETLRGVRSERANQWLERDAALAPKAALRALTGRTDAAAHELRDALFETGREVIDSVRGLDDDRSWQLRERATQRWPSTVLHSLMGLPASSRVAQMREQCEQYGAGDVHMLRRARGLDEYPSWPDWYTHRTTLEGED